MVIKENLSPLPFLALLFELPTGHGIESGLPLEARLPDSRGSEMSRKLPAGGEWTTIRHALLAYTTWGYAVIRRVYTLGDDQELGGTRDPLCLTFRTRH